MISNYCCLYRIASAGACIFALTQILAVQLLAQSDFSQVVLDSGMLNGGTASACWVDTDNDGDLDLAVSGTTMSTNTFCTFYRNDGSWNFAVDSSHALPAKVGWASWADYDNDGDLDAAIWGYFPLPDERVYPKAMVNRNDGGSYVDAGFILPSFEWGCMAWGDFNRDGFRDLFLSGWVDYSSQTSIVYRNAGGTGFVQSAIGSLTLDTRGAAWGDCDNDGDLDLLLVGQTTSQIWRNDGGDSFASLPLTLATTSERVCTWADVNGDGFVDAAFNGHIYSSDGGTSFAEVVTGFPEGPMWWGDSDNDGDLDVMIGGGYTGNLKLFMNTGSNTFSEAEVPTIQGGDAGAWGDADGDRDLDFVIMGQDGTIILQNNGATANTEPAAPTGLSAEVDSSGRILMRWSSGSDQNTPSNRLTYGVYVGSAAGSCNMSSPHADTGNGDRKIPENGNAQMRHEWVLDPDGSTNSGGESIKGYRALDGSGNVSGTTFYGSRLYWGVQTIDSAYCGSAFTTGVIDLPDADGDGLNDSFEASFGTSSNAADTDLDGKGDFYEFVSGSSPTNYNQQSDFFQVTNCVSSGSGDGIILEWPSLAGRLYNVFCSSNLTESWFSTEFMARPGNGQSMAYTGTVDRPATFYRVGISMP